MAAISIQGLSKTFPGGYRALDDVCFDVGSGEMIALIGASGSGKSTLIRHIAGLVQADRSELCCVAIGGEPMQQDGRLTPRAKALRRHIGVIFQQFNLVSRLSVMTNVLVGMLGSIPAWRGTLGLFTRQEKLLAMQALARVGIEGKARARAGTLSGGQQQRAAIARALIQGARVLLADEPIASLDPSSARRVMETLASLNREDGMTVIVSLHQVEYARMYCPRTIALKAGEVVFDGASTDLTAARLREIYGDASEELILPGLTDAAPAPAGARAGAGAPAGQAAAAALAVPMRPARHTLEVAAGRT
ncbi:phosphonate ABC transporter ATP-binding protein [Marinibaculum pumilum]|uniref:Phosphonate ABC transporter ATP-binding protein n=1 Tax=Marinibaculum pumilum TaxID=1766165 RepID=A0ABV7L1S0_9PROT